MLSLRSIVGFLLRLALFYGLLAAPWPKLREGYAAIFRTCGSTLFTIFERGTSVRFEPNPGNARTADTRIVMKTPWSHQPHAAELSSRMAGYLPAAQLAALVLAAPLRWARKWRALLWGLLWVNCFVAVRVWCIVFVVYSNTNPPRFNVGQLAADVVSVIASPTPAFLVAPLVFLAVALRRRDVEKIFGAGAPRSPSGH